MSLRTCSVLAACVLAAAALSACQSGSAHAQESEAYCRAPKPGTIVSVNHYCAVVSADPVDPEITTEWKGQTVCFCCKGCIPRWNKMTDEQKDAALSRALAKGKLS